MQEGQKNHSRRLINRFVGCGCITIIVIIIALHLIMSYIFGPLSLKDKEATEKDFIKNQELLFIVKDYFAELEYETLYYPSTNYWYPDSEKDGIFAGLEDGLENEYIPINNTEALNAINALFENGYGVLGKDGNCIYFQRWSNLDNGRGVVYSIDGSAPDESDLEFLTKLEPLKEEGWYYYEEDFNEYKRRHRELKQAAEDDFKDIQAKLFTVRDYFVELEYESLRDNTKGAETLFAYPDDGEITIDNPEAAKAINSLFQYGYKQIEKKANCIYYAQWDHLDNAKGFLYSIDGNVPDESSLQFLINFEPLEEDGWYYFKGDFSEYNRSENKYGFKQ